MKQYLEVVQNILEYGQMKSNRTGVDTLCLPFQTIRHNMSDGFPLLTTRKMAHKSIRVELEGFIKGITSKKWYQDRGCHIWDQWCNPKATQGYIDYCTETDRFPLPDKATIQQKQDDLGPIYGYQWRHFGAGYDEDDDAPVDGCDQLKRIIRLLKTNPNDRTMVCSVWNPNQIKYMALPPCHYAWNLVHINGVLHLGWSQRSCDFGLGVPFNIASYALLLILLCKETGLIPGSIHGTFADAHVYVNHLDQLKEQLKRAPRILPHVYIPNDNWTNIVDWDHKNFEILDYHPHPKINMPIAV